MGTSPNTNAAAVEQLSNGNSSGTSLGQDSSDLISLYGVTPVAQASAIVAVTGTVSLTTTMNAILTAIRDFGIIAS